MYHECEIVSIIHNIKSFYDFNKENISLDYEFVAKPLTRAIHKNDGYISRITLKTMLKEWVLKSTALRRIAGTRP